MKSIGALEAFVAVARTGTVRAASRELGRTQPSISTRLATLEAEWNVRLFRRESRGMVLTPEGARLLPRVESALETLQALDAAAGLPLAANPVLRVGAGDALSRVLLPRALGPLVRRQPRLEVYLREGSGPQLLDALREGEIDLAFVLRDVGLGAGDGIEIEDWITSPIDLLTPARGADDRGLDIPRDGAVPLRRLDGQPLVVLQPGSAFRRHLEQAFAAAGIAFRPAVEVGNLSLVRRFVASGLGVAPVPAIAFERRRKELSRAAITGIRGITALRYVRARRAGAPLPAAVAQLSAQLDRR